MQTAVSGAALALLGWLFLEVQEQGIAMARMSEQLSGLRVQIAAGQQDSYLGKDAIRDFAIRDSRMVTIEKRLEKVESHTGTTGLHDRR